MVVPDVVKVLGLTILIGGALLFVMDRLLLWMEARGLVYWRRTKPGGRGGVGNAFLEIHAMLEPGKRYVLEARRREEAAAEEDQDRGDGAPDAAPEHRERR